MMLGKTLPTIDDRTLQLANYVKPDLIITPNMVDYGARFVSKVGMTWGAMGNDRYGDCVYAAQGHKVQADTSLHGTPVTLPDSDILAAYARDTGFDPITGANDNGANMLEALKAWRKYGIGGHRIKAFVAVDPKNQRLTRIAHFLFGGLYSGYALPRTAQRQGTWTFVTRTGDGAPYSWGGHAIYEHYYSTKRRTGACITWGYPKEFEDRFKLEYCDEQYAALSDDWAPPNGVAVNGFDLQALLADLKRVAG